MATVPLQAVFRGDFVALLVSVDDRDTMDLVAQKVAYHVIHRRLPPQDAPLRVQYDGSVLPRDQTVAQAGMSPMSFVEVFYDASGDNAGMDSDSYPEGSLGRRHD
jgi:toluene monooxygenase system protein B